MPVKLSSTWKDRRGTPAASSTVEEYEDRFEIEKRGEEQERDHLRFNNLYYDLFTDFYEYGWGRSFHFAPRVPGESFKASIARHEHYLAHRLGLGPGMVVADLGCGVAGPLLEIARFTGAKIVGVNINAYQMERARSRVEEAGMSHLAEFLECDFMNVDAPDGSFDAVYSIEATCLAPNKVGIYGEAHRLLKPGGGFGVYEYVLTDRFDDQDPRHLQLKADIEFGGGLSVIDSQQTVDDALRAVGFEVIETRNLAEQAGPSIPWYEPLAGSRVSVASFRSSKIGRWVTCNSLRALETLRIAPRGAAGAAAILELCAAAMVEAGRLGIFSPMYFIHARKPS